MTRIATILVSAWTASFVLTGVATADTLVAAERESTGVAGVCEALCPAGHAAVSGRGRICEAGASNFAACEMLADDQGPIMAGFDADAGTPISGESIGWYTPIGIGTTTVVYAHCAPIATSMAIVPGLSGGWLTLVAASVIVGFATKSRSELLKGRE